jgi:membrane-bound serine protease (ClpP class)
MLATFGEMLTTVIGLGVAGVLLLFLEMFLPGLIAGVVGGVLLFAAVVVAYRDLGADAGNIALLAAVASTGFLWWWWATKFQHTRMGRRMTLAAASEGEAGIGSTLAALGGQVGTAITPLRPSGTVLVAGKRVDATTAGEFIDSGAQVRVVSTEGLAVVVRREG